MRKKFLLRDTQALHRLFTKGTRVETSFFRVFFGKNNLGHLRFVFVAPRKLDKRSVVRNRVRRRAREWFRKNKTLNTVSADIAVVFKKESIIISRKKFYEELEKVFTRVNTG